MKKKKLKFSDKVGLLVSSLCIVHCVLLPVSIVLFPTITSFLPIEEDTVHVLLILFIVPAVAFTIYSGLKVHGQRKPLYWMGGGLLFVLFGTFFVHNLFSHEWEPFFVLIGSLLLVRGHLLNSHHCRRCEEEHHCIWEEHNDQCSHDH